MDGCGYWRVYWNIILPLSRPILSAVSVVLVPRELNALPGHWSPPRRGPDSPSGQDPSFSTRYGANWNHVLAAAVVAVISMLALFLVFQRQMVESIKTSGLK